MLLARSSLSKVSQAQSDVKNSKTGEPVGPIPNLEFLLKWYGANLPGANPDAPQIQQGGRSLEARIVHGDFKIDNLVRLDLLNLSSHRYGDTASRFCSRAVSSSSSRRLALYTAGP